MKIPPLLPAPKRIRPRNDALALRSGIPLVLREGSGESDFLTARALAEALETRSGRRPAIETHFHSVDLGPRIELLREGEAGESYRLEVSAKGAFVRGEGPAGLRYGAETLAQLLVPGRRTIPGCEVEDAPDLETRGVLLDISRGKVPTLATLKSFVDEMVRLKMNCLMLYTEHVFQFRRHPLIGRGSSPMSARELRELDEYAAHRHVELVPTLQSLGHMKKILEIPRYRHLAESDRLWSISPSLEESYALLDDLYSEYLGNFRSPWLNANCDEPVDLGKGLSRSWAEKAGPGAIFASHLVRVSALASKYGKRPMFWADVLHDHKDAIPLLPKDLLLIDWWYEADHDFDRVRVFRDHGIAFMVAAGTSSWNTLFPRVANATANIRGYASAAKRHGARGLLVTDWGDGGHGNLLGNSLYGFACGAQAAWGDEDALEASHDDFDRAFSLQLFFDRSGRVSRLYRRLGSLHDTGFDHFNHSPLKSLYYDDLREPNFTRKVRRRRLAATLAKLEKVKADLERNEASFARRPEEREELGFAIDASIVAAEKGLAGAAYLELVERRREPSRGERRRLAKELARAREAQKRLLRRLERLWLARNHHSNFEITAGLYRESIAGLAAAIRKLHSWPGSSRSAGRGRGR